MPTREEIREGVASIDYQPTAWRDLDESIKEALRKRADATLRYLHDNDVVIKVDRELPKFPLDSELHPYGQAYVKGGRAYVQTLIDAGYVAVEPLIGDK